MPELVPGARALQALHLAQAGEQLGGGVLGGDGGEGGRGGGCLQE